MNTAEHSKPENPYIAIDKKWNRRKRVLKILIVVLVLSSPAIYRSSLLWKIPDVEEPFDVQEFVSYAPAENENAFTFYRRAASELTPEPRIPPPNPTPADKGVTAPLSRALDEIEFCNQPGVAHQKEWEKWIDENKQTLLDWKEGTTRTESLHIPPAEMEIDTLLETTQQLRMIKLLVVVKAKLLTEAGQLDEAWSWYRALFRCSRHLGHHSCAVDRLVGSYLYNTACKGVIHNWANNNLITDKQLALAILELPEFNTLTRPLSDQLKSDYMMYVNTLAAGNWPAKIETPGVGSASENDKFLNSIAYWLANEPSVSRRLLKIHFSQLLDALDEKQNPNKSINYLAKHMSVEELEPLVYSSVFGREFPGMYGNLFRTVADDKARQAVLIAFLSAYRFKLANGSFPQSIDELITTYPDTSFVDPNSASEEQLLGYRIDKENLLVWSVGLNGTNEYGNITRGYDQGADVGYEIKLKTDPKPAENSDKPGSDSPSPK